MKKTNAIAVLAVSGALLLSACGGSDVKEVEMPEPTATEETTTEANEANEANPQDEENYTENPQPNPIASPNEENLLPEPQVETVAGTEVTMNLDDVLEILEFSWFTTCPFTTPELILNDDGTVALDEDGKAKFTEGFNPRDTYVLEYDPEYLERPKAEEEPSEELEGLIDADGNIDEEALQKLTQEITEEEIAGESKSASTPKFTGNRITLEDSGDAPFGFVLEALKPGTTEVRVAYSCESSGDSFDKTWIIKINP